MDDNTLVTNRQENGDEGIDEFDLGLVEFMHDETRAIRDIINLKHTTRDKLTYMIFSVNLIFTFFLLGYVPHLLYYWHTVEAITLLSYRWYTYKKQHYHYFLFDFCYFTNALILLYLWVPDYLLGGRAIRGRLFAICYIYASGPVLSAILLWRNSLVPHSADKMISLFIHLSPSMTLWGIRWFSTPEQDFPLCSKDHPGEGLSACIPVDISEILYYPIFFYFIWQILYILVVDVFSRKKVKERNYLTSYKSLIERSQNSFLFRVYGIFGPKYRRLMFILLQFLYTLVSILLAYFFYIYKEVNMVALVLVTCVASYNGASFYIDVFSHKYQASLKDNE